MYAFVWKPLTNSKFNLATESMNPNYHPHSCRCLTFAFVRRFHNSITCRRARRLFTVYREVKTMKEDCFRVSFFCQVKPMATIPTATAITLLVCFLIAWSYCQNDQAKHLEHPHTKASGRQSLKSNVLYNVANQ